MDEKITAPSKPFWLTQEPSCFPDYQKWLQYEFWNLQDFAALIVGIAPSQMIEFVGKMENKLIPLDTKRKIIMFPNGKEMNLRRSKYNDLRSCLERSKLFQNSEKKATPIDCINWAVKNSISIPIELSEHISNISNDEVAENEKIKKLEGKLRGRTNSFNKLQKAFAALCKDKYNFDNDAQAMGRLQSSMDRGGFRLDDTTIRTHYKEGLNKIKNTKK